MPVIYLAAFQAGPDSLVEAIALTEDGKLVGRHLSSTIDWAKRDIVRSGHRQDYAKHYPGGYELVWIDDPSTDPRWTDVVR